MTSSEPAANEYGARAVPGEQAEKGTADGEERRLLQTITVLEAQRSVLGDSVVETAMSAVLLQLDSLRQRSPGSAAIRPGGIAASHERRLRLVTVLFTDTVGSTAFARTLEPEEIQAVLDTMLQAFTETIESHGGRVLQYTGDGLLAAFGADISNEDDARRAVSAALALVELAESAGATALGTRLPLRVRVGLNTGTVLLGGGVDAEGTIRGAAVNLAARMEQVAEPGTVRIAPSTHRHVADYFELDEKDPVVVKGYDRPLVTYRVIDHRREPGPHSLKGSSSILDTSPRVAQYIGRDVHLALLSTAYAAVCTEGVSSWCLLIGEAGVGKTRLLDEFEQRLRREGYIAAAMRCTLQPADRRGAFSLVRRLVIAFLDTLVRPGRIDESASLTEMVEDHLHGRIDDDDIRLLVRALTLDSARSVQAAAQFDAESGADSLGIESLRLRLFRAVRSLLNSLAPRGGSVQVLALDDLQSADDASLDFVSRLAGELPERTLVVIAARLDVLERLPDWLGRKPPSLLRIDLPPLTSDEALALARWHTRVFDPPTNALCDLLVSKSEGNPFYMGELFQMLIDSGIVASDGGPLQVSAASIACAHIPSTITGILQARLDQLPAAARVALQKASTAGTVFWEGALRWMQCDIGRQIPVLTGRAMVRELPSSTVPGEREFIFTSLLLQQTAYDSILRAARREYHASTARWLQVSSDKLTPSQRALIGEHFERAGDLVAASTAFAACAEVAAASYAHDVVLEQTARGLAIVEPGNSALRWTLLSLRQRADRILGQMNEQWSLLEQMQAIAEFDRDEEKVAVVSLRRGMIHSLTGDFSAAVEFANYALQAARRLDLGAIELSASSVLSGSYRALGQLTEAREITSAALKRAIALKDPMFEGEALVCLAAVANDEGRSAEAISLLRRGIQVHQNIGYRYGLCGALINLGDSEYRIGAYEQAKTDLLSGLEIAQAIGLRAEEAIALLNLSSVEHFLGSHDTATKRAEEAIEVAERIGNPQFRAFAWQCAGQAHLGARRWRLAQQAFERARDGLRSINAAMVAIEAIAGLAEVALESGQTAEAGEYVSEVLDHLAKVGHFHGTEHPIKIRITCFRVLAALGDQRAAALRAEALKEIEAMAASISDLDLRETFLNGVPYHRHVGGTKNAYFGPTSGIP
jgi:class 3 adenylate cyclase/tetratricopeptide (TPR) repeat protein